MLDAHESVELLFLLCNFTFNACLCQIDSWLNLKPIFFLLFLFWKFYPILLVNLVIIYLKLRWNIKSLTLSFLLPIKHACVRLVNHSVSFYMRSFALAIFICDQITLQRASLLNEYRPKSNLCRNILGPKRYPLDLRFHVKC